MSYWYIIVVILFVIVAGALVRRSIRGAIFESMPLLPGESVLLQETGLKVFQKIREASGGQSLTSRVTVLLTDRRILVATGGPEGKHKFFMKMILDYRTPAPPVEDTGYGAYYEKFQLEKGYSSYYISPSDVRFVEKKGQLAVHIKVPFPEHGAFYLEPEVIIYTQQPQRYGEVFGLSHSMPPANS
jgi:hypothetical protein